MSSPDSSQQSPKLLDLVRNTIRLKHYAYRTEQSYLGWIKRYIHFHRTELGEFRHPAEMGPSEIEAFLTYLAVDQHVLSMTTRSTHGDN